MSRNKSGLCLDAWGQQLWPGTRVSVYACWGGANQQWWPNETTNTIHLANSSGLCLTKHDQDLIADTCHDDDASQKWSFISAADGIVTADGQRHFYVDSTPETFLVRKQYYAYKQFTRFIRPGDTILMITNNTDRTILASREPGGNLTVIMVNPSSSSRIVSIQLPMEYQNSQTIVFQTSNSLNCDMLGPIAVGNDAILSADLPEESITTFLVAPNMMKVVTSKAERHHHPRNRDH